MAHKCDLTIEGRLATDMVLNYSKSGTCYINFRIAHDRKDKNGPNGFVQDFYTVTAYDNTAEILAQMKKGDTVQLDARLKKSEYENKQGVKVKDTELIAYRAVRLDMFKKAGAAPKAFDDVELEDELADES